MPEPSAGEKTLPASETKKRKAREEGNIARSQDLTSAWALLVALLALRFIGPQMLEELVGAVGHFFANAHNLLPDQANVQRLTAQTLLIITRTVLPFATVMLAAGLAINLFQVGFLFTAKPLTPKLEKLNPAKGLGKFFSLRSFVEMVKSLLKLICVSLVVWLSMRGRIFEFANLMHGTPMTVMAGIGAVVFTVWWRIALALIIIGILDYGFQYWQRERELMMTVQEAREEAKELEGDPKLRARVRQVQRQLAMQRMLAEVPLADVIITNPVRYAVAIRYDMTGMGAPVVVAKGARLIAEKIRDLAVEHDVPIVQKPDVARTLYRTIEVGQPIPEKLFHAVAEILAYVYQIDRRAEKVREREQMMAAMQAA